jgi:hypothetical protein
MKSLIRYSFFLFLFFLVAESCSKEDINTPNDLVFQSLVAEKDTIAPGEKVKIKASATGSQLEYFWSVTLGDIIGSGAEITYAASPCAVGTNTVTCKINNGNQSDTKTVEIVVYE